MGINCISSKKILLLTLLLGFTIMANAQIDVISEKIYNANLKINSISASFIQTKRIAFMQGDVTSNGSFFYEKPDKLAMKYDKPAGDLMILNEDQFVMIADGKYSKRSVKQNSNVSQLQNILSSCLHGDFKKMNASEFKHVENAQQYIITANLNKASDNSAIEQVVISYDKSDMALSSLQTIESDGSFTLYRLENKKLNTSFDESVFVAPEKQKK